MGKIEKNLKKQLRASKIQTAILKTVAAVGMISVAMLAPNALQAFGILFRGKNRNNLYRAKTSISKLIKNGFLKVEQNEIGDKKIILTEKGEEKMQAFRLKDYKLSIPKKWDRKYRIVIFDIKEERKRDRESIRLIFSQMGFVRLQDSVWVYPYDCEDFITLLKTDFQLGTSVLYIIADHIENDRWLRREFNLESI